MKRVQKGSFSFSGHQWQHVSDEAKDFVSKLLTVDEGERMSAPEALSHRWIRSRADSAWSELRPDEYFATAEALKNLMRFSARSKLKQAAYTLIASQMLVKEETEAFDSVFRRLDKSCNGRLSRTEIRLALVRFHCAYSAAAAPF